MSHLIRKIDARLIFFFNYHLKMAFLIHGCNKTSAETLYEYLEQKMIKDKN